ncbi:MAG: elongation factor G [Anaerolineales bacterium]|nr:elongation factor G [Anaerolineales bacterium]MCB9126493.1 elongation factor G [Ardenticatenales bacterium]
MKKSYPTSAIRNVALLSHSSAGKTTISEALLHMAGVTKRQGRVEDHNTVSDFDPEEQRRGISINMTVLPFDWKGTKINLIDTPGYLDFVGDVRSALHVSDGAVIVVDAVSGVEVGTELMWDEVEARGLPRLLFVNKMDRDTARFRRTMDSLNQTFPDAKIVPVQLPIGEGESFAGFVSLVTRKAYDEKGNPREIPSEMADEVDEAIFELMESAAEGDDELIMKYLDGEELTVDEVWHGLKAMVGAGQMVPVLVGSAHSGVGLSALANAIVELLPSPEGATASASKGDETVELNADQNGPLAVYIFKTVVDPYGSTSLFRVYSGAMHGDQRLHNQRGEEERIGPLFVLRGKEQVQVDELAPGDIGALAKLSHSHTGDTLGEVAVQGQTMPSPTYSAALFPKNQSDVDKLSSTLHRIVMEDPSLTWIRREDTHQMVLAGQGDTHLDVARHRLERLGVAVDLETPRVAYKETVMGQATSRYRHKKQTGGAGQFGEVELRVEPTERGDGFDYGWEVFGGAVSQGFRPSIEKGIRQMLDGGVIAGYPVVDVRAVVTDGKEHPVDSKDIAFQIAGRNAFRDAFRNARPVLLEPIYNVSVTIPDQYLGDVMGDLNTRRGRVSGMQQVGNKSVVEAQVPESSLLRYAVELRSMTQGHGQFTMEFDHYDAVPDYIAQEIIAEAKIEHHDD